MKLILLTFFMTATTALAATTRTDCVLGPQPGDGEVTLSTGEKVNLPGCWYETGFYEQGFVPASAIEPLVAPYGLHVLGGPGIAVVGVGAFDYSSTPVGPFREVFIAAFVTRQEHDIFLTLDKVLGLFRVPGLSQPPQDYGLFVLKSYIDADDSDLKARAIRFYSEVFGYGEPAEITVNTDNPRFTVAQNNTTLFDVRMPEKAGGLVLGLTNQYNYDHALIGQNKWARMSTKGYMGESSNFSGNYKFFADSNNPWSALLSGVGFSAPIAGQGTSYFYYANAVGEMHMPVAR